MKLLVKKLNNDAVLPYRATEESAGYDLSSCEEVTINPHETVKIHTGIAVELIDAPDSVMLVYARSSLAVKHGLAPANCVGVIDTDYRGEIIVVLKNSSDDSYTVAKGERIAQLVVTPIFLPDVEEVQCLSETKRGSGGFGSTGHSTEKI